MSEERSDLSVLDSEHADVFNLALGRLLSSDVAEATLSNILDYGLPTTDAWREFHSHGVRTPYLKRVRSFRRQFNPLQLSFPITLLSAFDRTHRGTKHFELRLIELLGVADQEIVHRVHQEWRHQQLRKTEDYLPPTAFWVRWYTNVEQYLNGVADMCRDLFLHAGYIRGPTTIFPPTPAQFPSLIDYLLGSEPGAPSTCPIPIRATTENRWRYDPWDSMSYNIFRDRHERKAPIRRKPHRCVVSGGDWPEVGDEHLVTLLQWEASQGMPVDPADIDAAYERMRQITPSSPLWQRWRDPGPL
ncbi:hypothetical protein N658DRAFT_569336 [Parathielavia hyrcaniae]|uniref:Uncharacterized protein n=1 Tax=Parathielavia hyrcaniae TaxID=113614 RepID=A0AAN6PVK8_9PEZI|nr:hypothetical protein N658DRAFT_569336 [Parathielavia hyrcaniae]